MPTPIKPYYQYYLRVEIPATDVAVLVDALEGEAFSLREQIGKDALRRQLDEQQIKLDVRADERWPDFQRDIETLSVYLSEPISGREIHVEPGPGGPLLHGWVILGRRGETVRLALDVVWDVEAQALVDRGIDVEDARRRWEELPEWVRSSLTNQGAAPGPRHQGPFRPA
jgi:hypothetical protein